MESRVTDSTSIACFKLIIVRHAPTGDLTRHTLKIDTSSDSCRLCSPPLQTHFHPYPPPGRVILSGGRHFRRMDPGQRFFSAVQDFRIGLPGMALQIFGGYLFISRLIYK